MYFVNSRLHAHNSTLGLVLRFIVNFYVCYLTLQHCEMIQQPRKNLSFHWKKHIYSQTVIFNLNILFMAAHCSSTSYHYSLFHTDHKNKPLEACLNLQKSLLKASQAFNFKDLGKELLC